jgi:hypothetical protein
MTAIVSYEIVECITIDGKPISDKNCLMLVNELPTGAPQTQPEAQAIINWFKSITDQETDAINNKTNAMRRDLEDDDE